jgi:hypothetical protein
MVRGRCFSVGQILPEMRPGTDKSKADLRGLRTEPFSKREILPSVRDTG